MIEIEESSGNVYQDLGIADADAMSRKAQLASKIGEIIQLRQWTQQKAAENLNMTQPKLSDMLRGHFRGISETKMLDCLSLLGQDVTIQISPTKQIKSIGNFTVSFVEDIQESFAEI
jgi:predicted XRE-type DNA-binding protein